MNPRGFETTPLSQRDPRWAGELLGFNSNPEYSIGGWGCLLAALTMAAKLDSLSVVNALLKLYLLFVQNSGVLATWFVGKALPLQCKGYSTQQFIDKPMPADEMRQVCQHVRGGNPAIGEVDFYKWKRWPKWSQHFVLLTKVDDLGRLWCIDPWDLNPVEKLLAPAYGKTDAEALVRVVRYRYEPSVLRVPLLAGERSA